MSQSHIPHLKDFRKKVDTLLTCCYPAIKVDRATDAEYVESSAGVSVAVKPRSNFSLKSSVTNAKGNGKESTTAKFNVEKTCNGGCKTTGEFNTKGVLKAAFHTDKIPVDGLKVGVALEAEKKKQLVKVCASFCHEFFHAHADVSVPVKQPLFDFVDAKEIAGGTVGVAASVTTGLKEQNVYVAASVNGKQVGDTNFLEKYAVTGLFRDGSFEATLGYEQQFQEPAGADGKADGKNARTVSSTFTAAVTPELTTAVSLEHEINDSSTVATVGVGYPLNADSQVSAKVDTLRRAGFTFNHTLSANSSLSVGALFETAGSDIKSHYAFKLSLNQ